MRTIKFRAWNQENKRMMYDIPFATDSINYFSEAAEKSGYTLMQFTGLLDKNGKEIYAGDIMDYNGVVTFEKGMFCFNGCDPIWEMGYEKQEIIGNIYENPELIKNNYK